MAYCIAKSIEIQRSKALKEIFLEGRSVAQVARRFGRNRSTLYRWIKRWREINNYPDFRNYGRPNRAPGKKFRLESLKWRILTRSSAPRIHSNALDKKLVAYVISSPFFLISFKILVFPFEFNIFFAIYIYVFSRRNIT